jgi:hypothetical protein
MKKTVSGTFAVGSSETAVIQLNELYTLTGITITGSVITGSLVTILGSVDGTNFYSAYNSSSTELSLTVTSASRTYAVDPNAFLPYDFIKARLGTSGSAKLQATYNAGVLFHLKTIE